MNYVPVGMCTDSGEWDISELRRMIAADPTIVDRLFHGYVNSKLADAVQVLIEAGADLNANALGITPLVLAVECHSPEIVRLLIAAGADVNLKDESGISPLMAASMPGKRNTAQADVLDEAIIQILTEAGAVDTLLPDGSRPVVKRDPYPFGDKLRNTDQETLDHLLSNAAKEGQIEAMLDLLEVGADGLASALISAIVGKQTQTVTRLLSMGADVNIDYRDITPLVCAAERRSPEIVRLLIAAGADVNKRDGFGITPMMATQLPENRKSRRASRADNEIAQILKAAGSHEPLSVDQLPRLIGRTGSAGDWTRHATPDWLNGRLRICADWPFMNPDERDEIEDVLAWSDSTLALTASLQLARLPEFVELCIAAGADVNYHNPEWKTTPLIWASSWHMTEVVRILISAGADVNTIDEQGTTPLMAAERALLDIHAKLADKSNPPSRLVMYEEVQNNLLENIKLLKGMGAIR
jgi:ankyrin repeat protein